MKNNTTLDKLKQDYFLTLLSITNDTNKKDIKVKREKLTKLFNQMADIKK